MTIDTKRLRELLAKARFKLPIGGSALDWVNARDERQSARDALADYEIYLQPVLDHIDALEARVEKDAENSNKLFNIAVHHEDRADAAERQRDEAIAALKFYARAYNWRSSTVFMCGHSGQSSAELDAGNKARQALAQIDAVKVDDYEPAPDHDCPKCGSNAPHLHPAVQVEGEVELCTDDYHLIRTNQNRYVDDVLRKRTDAVKVDTEERG